MEPWSAVSQPIPTRLGPRSGVYTQLTAWHSTPLEMRAELFLRATHFSSLFHKIQTCGPQIGCDERVVGRLGEEGQGSSPYIPPGPVVPPSPGRDDYSNISTSPTARGLVFLVYLYQKHVLFISLQSKENVGHVLHKGRFRVHVCSACPSWKSRVGVDTQTHCSTASWTSPLNNKGISGCAHMAGGAQT